MLGVSNPFRSKWKQKSTTIEMKDESSTTDSKRTSAKKSKDKIAPFNSDSLLNGIGDYIFQSPLGDGKFSKVILAKHYLSGELVAIKVIDSVTRIYSLLTLIR